jgi:hypothetical protein
LNSAEPITAMSNTAAGMNRVIIGAPPGLVDLEKERQSSQRMH